jgi:hypothetical protein
MKRPAREAANIPSASVLRYWFSMNGSNSSFSTDENSFALPVRHLDCISRVIGLWFVPFSIDAIVLAIEVES